MGGVPARPFRSSARGPMQKLGMRLEGTFVEFVSFTKDYAGNPIYENTLQYAILRREWMSDALV